MALLSSPIAHNHTHTPCSTQLLMCLCVPVCESLCMPVCVSTVSCTEVQQRAAVWEDKNIKTHTAETRSHVCTLLFIHPSSPPCFALLFSLTLTADLQSLNTGQIEWVFHPNLQVFFQFQPSNAVDRYNYSNESVKTVLCESLLDKCHAVSYDWLVTLSRARLICWQTASAVD